MAPPLKQDVVEPKGGKKITPQKARQGQNIKGMIPVLVISLVLVIAGFAITMGLGANSAGKPPETVGTPASPNSLNP